MLPEPRKPLENKLYSAELFSFQNKTGAVGDVRKKVEGDAQVVQKYPWLWSMFLNLLYLALKLWLGVADEFSC